MSPENQHSEEASRSELEKGLQASLSEKQAGRVFGPFTAAEETMEFLRAFQPLALFFEKTLREAANLGKRYDPKAVYWILDLDDEALDRKLKGRQPAKA
jgi:hypothetical protein